MTHGTLGSPTGTRQRGCGWPPHLTLGSSWSNSAARTRQCFTTKGRAPYWPQHGTFKITITAHLKSLRWARFHCSDDLETPGAIPVTDVRTPFVCGVDWGGKWDSQGEGASLHVGRGSQLCLGHTRPPGLSLRPVWQLPAQKERKAISHVSFYNYCR